MTRRSKKADETPIPTIAIALAEADQMPDAQVAERFGVARATIRYWRQRAANEPELGELLAAARRKVLDAWRPEAALTQIATMREIRRRLELREEVPFWLIALAKTMNAANIEAGALLPDPGTGVGEPPS